MFLKKFFCILQLFLFQFTLMFASDLEIPSDADFWSDYPNEELARFISENMSDEELLAQIFMFGWSGSEPSQLVMDWIKLRSIGSLKVYGWGTDNVVDVARSVVQVQTAASQTRFKIPLYIATDQEGGWIRHIKGATSDTPGNLSIGASGEPQDAFYSGYYIAKELRAMGVNMNFAPTVDIYSNLNSSVIGPRSFGSDAENTAVLGSSFASGTLKAGVIPTAKHFPGHGATRFDSHGRLPEINISKEVLENRELLPFKYLVKENIPAIMVGHLCFPEATGSKVPATFSEYFLQDVLRNQFGYKGLIITDDMKMYGATIYAGNLMKSFRMAIEAGNDIIISSTTAQLNEDVWTQNLAYMKKSKEFKDKVQSAAYRVILSKLQYFKGDNFVPIYPDVENVTNFIPDREGEKFFLNQACKSLTVYQKESDSIKITETDSSKIMLAGQYEKFIRVGQEKYPDAKTFYYNYSMGPNETEWTSNRFYEVSKNCSTIIIGCANEQAVSVAKQAERLKKNGKRVIIVSMLVPTYFMNGEWESDILMCYSYSPYSFKAVFSALSGEFEPNGCLPLEE